MVVESWLHNKAPLVTDRAGVAELIEEGRNGLLFDPDDTEALAQKMTQLLDDARLARRIGQQGHATSRRCSLDAGVKAETEVITQLVGE